MNVEADGRQKERGVPAEGVSADEVNPQSSGGEQSFGRVITGKDDRDKEQSSRSVWWQLLETEPQATQALQDTLNPILESLRQFRDETRPDLSLSLGYQHRILSPAFIRDSALLLKSGAEDQYLYSIVLGSSLILRERASVGFSYSFIPEQSNFSEPVVLEFENARSVANEMIRYRGNALTVSAAWLQPVTEGFQVGIHVGYTRMKLTLDERIRFHPADPFALNYRVVRLPVSNRLVTISNPYAALTAEIQLRRVWLEAGYDLQLFRLQQISSSGFHLSVKIRLSDLF